MDKELFLQWKQRLNSLLAARLEASQSEKDKESLLALRELLDQYTFENRLRLKGTVTHTIVDGLMLDSETSTEFIRFDQGIH